MKQSKESSLLRGLQEAWVSWDYYAFMDKFFVNRFPQYKDYKDDKGNYTWSEGSYPHEKWMKFKDNPVSYMCNMDDTTMHEFAKAIKKEMN